jgi:hypothetical protein
VPVPALAAAAVGLALRAKPQALGRAAARQGSQIVIGGSGLCDRLDRKPPLFPQKSDPAALRETRSSGAISR